MKTILPILLIFFSFHLFSQQVVFEDVKEKDVKGLGYFKDLGYISLIEHSDAKGKSRAMSFIIHNEDLEEISNFDVQLPRKTSKPNIAFNAEMLVLAIFDESKFEDQTYVYNYKGNLLSSKKVSRLNLNKPLDYLKTYFNSNKDVFYYQQIYNGIKIGNKIVKVNSKLDEEWVIELFSEDKKKLNITEVKCVGKNIFISYIEKNENSRAIHSYLKVFDSKNGSQILSFQLDDEKYNFDPYSFKVNNKSIDIVGLKFIGDKINNRKSDGAFYRKYSFAGEIIASHHFKLNHELFKDYEICLHDIVETGDSVLIVGELYRNKFKPIRSVLLQSVEVDFELSDIVSIQLNKEYQIKNVSIIEKPKQKLLTSVGFTGEVKIAKMLKKYDWFEYDFVKNINNEIKLYYSTRAGKEKYYGVGTANSLKNEIYKEKGNFSYLSLLDGKNATFLKYKYDKDSNRLIYELIK